MSAQVTLQASAQTAIDFAAPKSRGKRGPYQKKLALVAKPIVKSAGGKTRLLPQLLAHLPSQPVTRYLEPFCGGAALYFALAQRGALESAILCDLNVEIVELYAALAHDVEAVIRSYDGHVRDHERDARQHYYFARDLLNDDAVEMGTHERAALVLYINHACFNGLWRVNRAGRFNVPIGRSSARDGDGYMNVAIDPGHLRQAARALSNVTLLAGDYRIAIAHAQPGDFCYFDPPYDGAGSFVSYTSAGFDLDEQENLEINARALAASGVRVMVSNADTDLTRELYRDRSVWHVHELAAPRSIAASGQRRSKAKELLITSYATSGARS